jgi:trehalose synthase
VTLKDVGVSSLDPGRFEAVLDPDDCRRFLDRLAKAADRLAGRRLWQVNSTEQGGGVAEMLHFLLGYLTGAGIDTRWVVIEGNQEFFQVTKRVHHLLHGQPGDGGELDEPAQDTYRQTLKETLGELEQRVEPGDVVVLHDPKTAGLVPALKQQGVVVIWSCHVGVDQPNDLARAAWEFLRPAVQQADAYVFSRAAYCWEGLDRARLAVIAPCIDAFAPKNQTLEPATVNAILHTAGILEDPAAKVGTPGFRRLDGSPGRVGPPGRDDPGPAHSSHGPAGRPGVALGPAQGSLGRAGGLRPSRSRGIGGAFGAGGSGGRLGQPRPRSRAGPPAGPPGRGGAATGRPRPGRRCHGPPATGVHLAYLPMADLEENAAMVNALQRRADVIVQKSLAEGFGLTVAEAMWKARPVLASRVGGIQDQIRHGHSGLLLEDPSDLVGFDRAVQALLTDRDRAQRMGQAAHRRVCSDYLAPRRLIQDLDLIDRMAG